MDQAAVGWCLISGGHVVIANDSGDAQAIVGKHVIPPGSLHPAVLKLIDLSLAGNLLLIVIFSGYENFVSKMNMDGHEDRPEWQGTVDFSGLKLKLIASIVAISGIHLLKVFMDAKNYDLEYLKWYVIIHLTFVGSAFATGYLDKVTKHD